MTKVAGDPNEQGGYPWSSVFCFSPLGRLTGQQCGLASGRCLHRHKKQKTSREKRRALVERSGEETVKKASLPTASRSALDPEARPPRGSTAVSAGA